MFEIESKILILTYLGCLIGDIERIMTSRIALMKYFFEMSLKYQKNCRYENMSSLFFMFETTFEKYFINAILGVLLFEYRQGDCQCKNLLQC